MKVLLYTTCEATCGIAEYSRFLKDALQKKGVVVDIISLETTRCLKEFIKIGKLANDSHIAHIQYDYLFFGRNVFKNILNHLFFLNQIKVPKVITVHEPTIPQDKKPFFRLKKLALFLVQKLTFPFYKLIIVHSRGSVDYLERIGISLNNIEVMMHPVPERIAPQFASDTFINSLGIGKNKVITIFGFVTKRKKFELIFPLASEIDNCIFLIAGGSHSKDKSGYFNELKAKIKEMNLEGKVKMLGYVASRDLPAVMAVTDLIFVPLFDSFGSGSVSFAAAYRKPILAPDVEYFRELKNEGLGVELFKNGESKELKRKMVDLLYCADKRLNLEKLNDIYAVNNNYGNIADRTVSFYRRLIK